jgi:two-component system LytT family response regulator
MKYKCIVVDDEPLALKQLADYVSKTPSLELIAKCNNAFEALEMFSTAHVDAIFVDINMPEMSGLELVNSLPYEMKVVFTTAYSEYAVDSYKLDAIDYLLKPISYQNFLRAANKLSKAFEGESETDPHFFVKSEGKLVKIVLKDIEYIESLNEYVKIKLVNDKSVVTLMSLKSLENRLSDSQFMRVHRSYIVNLSAVEVVERNRIIFSDKKSVPVSDNYRVAFKEFIDRNFY